MLGHALGLSHHSLLPPAIGGVKLTMVGRTVASLLPPGLLIPDNISSARRWELSCGVDNFSRASTQGEERTLVRLVRSSMSSRLVSLR